jgi:transcription elongation GreA/GreB family factor
MEMEKPPLRVNPDKVITVNIIDPPEGELRIYLLDKKGKNNPNVNPSLVKVSTEAPLGKALLDHFLGDQINYTAPDGINRLVIITEILD